jgi:hypothetical protein
VFPALYFLGAAKYNADEREWYKSVDGIKYIKAGEELRRIFDSKVKESENSCKGTVISEEYLTSMKRIEERHAIEDARGASGTEKYIAAVAGMNAPFRFSNEEWAIHYSDCKYAELKKALEEWSNGGTILRKNKTFRWFIVPY